MKLTQAFAAALLAAGICCAGPASAAASADQYLLTQGVLDRMKAAEIDLVAAGHRQGSGNDHDGGDDAVETPTVEGLIRTIEADTPARAALAKHGLTSTDYALASFAVLHAGFYVVMERAMDRNRAAGLLATFTREQKANIALVRSMKQ